MGHPNAFMDSVIIIWRRVNHRRCQVSETQQRISSELRTKATVSLHLMYREVDHMASCYTCYSLLNGFINLLTLPLVDVLY